VTARARHHLNNSLGLVVLCPRAGLSTKQNEKRREVKSEQRVEFLRGIPHLAAAELSKIGSVPNGSKILIDLQMRPAFAIKLSVTRVDEDHVEAFAGNSSCTLEIVRKVRGSSAYTLVRCPYCEMPRSRLFEIIHIVAEKSEEKLELSFACWDCADPKMLDQSPRIARRRLRLARARMWGRARR
jgi:hypothetical protein